MSQNQKRIVLVHGAWHTGDCWSEVVRGLQEVGYEVIAPTMPGHGKNANRNNISFRDYETALLNVLRAIVKPTVLLGHSSAGVLLQAVAPVLPAHVLKLVFLNAFILGNDKPLIDAVPPAVAGQFRASAARSEDNSLPVDEGFFRHVILSGESEEVQRQIITRLSPQPFSYYLHGINYGDFLRTDIPKIFLHAVDDASLPDAGYQQMAGYLGQYERIDIPGGHEVMYTHPQAVVAALRQIF